MMYFLSCVFILSVISFIGLFVYKQWLECRVLVLQLPKRKKKKVVKKVVIDDELSED